MISQPQRVRGMETQSNLDLKREHRGIAQPSGQARGYITRSESSDVESRSRLSFGLALSASNTGAHSYTCNSVSTTLAPPLCPSTLHIPRSELCWLLDFPYCQPAPN